MNKQLGYQTCVTWGIEEAVGEPLRGNIWLENIFPWNSNDFNSNTLV